MAVIEVLTYEVKPGRLEDFLADVRQLQQILPQVDVGLLSVRVLRLMMAGADSGRVALMVENTDTGVLGARVYRGQRERGTRKSTVINTRWQSAGILPSPLVHRMLLRDIPL